MEKIPESEARKLWRSMFDVSDQLRGAVLRQQRKECMDTFSSLTYRQTQVIKIICDMLEDYPDGLTLKMITEKLQLSPGTVSETVETLVKKEVLQRVTSTVDRRAVCITLAGKGVELLNAGRHKLDELMDALLKDFSEEEKNTLHSMFRRLRSKLENNKTNIKEQN